MVQFGFALLKPGRIYFGYTKEENPMRTKIQKWGNSQGLRISRDVLDSAHVSVGDEVNVAVNDGAIVITPVKQIRRRCNLDELLAQIPADYRPEELDWGKPRGKEIW
jgi:antitoxin MazE